MTTTDDYSIPTLSTIVDGDLEEQFQRCLSEVIRSYGDEKKDPNKARRISMTLTFVKRQGGDTVEINAEAEVKLPASRGAVGFGTLDGDRLDLILVPHHQEEMFGDEPGPTPVVAFYGRDDR